MPVTEGEIQLAMGAGPGIESWQYSDVQDAISLAAAYKEFIEDTSYRKLSLLALDI